MGENRRASNSKLNNAVSSLHTMPVQCTQYIGFKKNHNICNLFVPSCGFFLVFIHYLFITPSYLALPSTELLTSRATHVLPISKCSLSKFNIYTKEQGKLSL